MQILHTILIHFDNIGIPVVQSDKDSHYKRTVAHVARRESPGNCATTNQKPAAVIPTDHGSKCTNYICTVNEYLTMDHNCSVRGLTIVEFSGLPFPK